MSKKDKQSRKQRAQAALELKPAQTESLVVLLLQKAHQESTVTNYLIHLLTGAGLDPREWGVSADCKRFEKLQAQPAPPAQRP